MKGLSVSLHKSVCGWASVDKRDFEEYNDSALEIFK